MQPLGIEYSEPEIGPKGWVCQLNQALYGLRDSAKLWNDDLNAKLEAIGFVPLDDDPCVYIKGTGSTAWFLIVHIDDLSQHPFQGGSRANFPRCSFPIRGEGYGRTLRLSWKWNSEKLPKQNGHNISASLYGRNPKIGRDTELQSDADPPLLLMGLG